MGTSSSSNSRFNSETALTEVDQGTMGTSSSSNSRFNSETALTEVDQGTMGTSSSSNSRFNSETALTEVDQGTTGASSSSNSSSNSKTALTEDNQTRSYKIIKSIASILIGLLMIAMIGMVVSVVVKTSLFPNKQLDSQKLSSEKEEFRCSLGKEGMTEIGKFRVNKTISIVCHYSSIIKRYITNSSILVTFIKNLSHTVENTEVNVTLQSNISVAGDWEIRSSPQIEIRGGQAECGGDGFFKITLITPTERYNDTVILKLETKTEVHLEIGYLSETKFQITCSSSSKCRSNSGKMTLFVYDNKTNGPIPNPDFNCNNETYDLGIWRLHCNGSFSKDSVINYERVGCRLHLTNQTATEYTEGKISTKVLCNDPGCFMCPEDAHNGHYLDERRCDIYHRCDNGVPVSMPCALGTYFSTTTCTCDHTKVLILKGICNTDGSRVQPSSQKSGCGASTR